MWHFAFANLRSTEEAIYITEESLKSSIILVVIYEHLIKTTHENK